MLGRHASLVSAGTDKQGQPKLFRLWTTFPWHLQKESSLLALHFGSVGLFIILLLLLTLLSLWPLAACIAADELEQNYTVTFGLQNGQEVQGRAECLKRSKVRPNTTATFAWSDISASADQRDLRHA